MQKGKLVKLDRNINVKVTEDTVTKMDKLIVDREFDSYAQIIRKALKELLGKYEEEIP